MEMPEELFKQMLETIHEKIPNFNPKHFDGITYQGTDCSYNPLP